MNESFTVGGFLHKYETGKSGLEACVYEDNYEQVYLEVLGQ